MNQLALFFRSCNRGSSILTKAHYSVSNIDDAAMRDKPALCNAHICKVRLVGVESVGHKIMKYGVDLKKVVRAIYIAPESPIRYKELIEVSSEPTTTTSP